MLFLDGLPDDIFDGAMRCRICSWRQAPSSCSVSVHAVVRIMVCFVLTACGHSGVRSEALEVASQRRVIDIPVEPRDTDLLELGRARTEVTASLHSLRRCMPMRTARIYALGSSTMASLLGPALKRIMKREWPEASLSKWGKPSSGLARPDFHDWPRQIPKILRRHKPDMFVVSLGTNDYQAVRLRNGSWVRPGTARWKRVYASRVRKMLQLMSGPSRSRAVIWVGPTSFPGEGSKTLGPLITKILRREIRAFGGPAVLIDAYGATTDDRNRPRDKFRIPGKRGWHQMRGHDGIHLTIGAVRALMARPVADSVSHCRKGGVL